MSVHDTVTRINSMVQSEFINSNCNILHCGFTQAGELLEKTRYSAFLVEIYLAFPMITEIHNVRCSLLHSSSLFTIIIL